MSKYPDKILIVDDEAPVRLVLGRYIEDEKYVCIQANCGEEALELVKKEKFSAMVLDIMMPGISGLEVLKKSLEIDENIAIIMVTAVDDSQTAYRSLQLGAFGYIVKPFHKNEILINIKNALLRRELTIANKQYEAGLEALIAEKTGKLEEKNQALVQQISDKSALEESLRKALTQSRIFSDKLKKQKENLDKALAELSGLILAVTQKKDFSVRFSNPDIPACYELKQCSKKDCPCYEKGAQRCWQVAGTQCDGSLQGDFAKKYTSCSDCCVYKHATDSFTLHIGEEFNNMMHILEQKNKTLEKAYKTLQKTQEQIIHQEKMASIGQLSAGIFHEIKSPLTYVSGNTEMMATYSERISDFISHLPPLIENSKSPETQRVFTRLWNESDIDYLLKEFKDIITDSIYGCERIKSITSDLKSFSYQGNEKMDLVDINSNIDNALNIVWHEVKNKADLKKEYGDLPLVRCIPQQINQVFINLLNNASQAIEIHGEIAIKTWHEADCVCISISDTGSGISEDHQKKLFTPFFTTKKIGVGTGLGLSISRQIIENHRGTISFQSKINSGTIFTVRLPLITETQSSDRNNRA